MNGDMWPSLILQEWWPTYATLHRWTQIVGKTRLALTPFENHWWNAALYVTPHGLGTSAIPCDAGLFEIELDFLFDALTVRTSEAEERTLRLESKSVAEFYAEYREMLESLGIRPHIVATPNELPDATPFTEDTEHATYDGDAARRWWHALVGADQLFKRFRARFSGKCSPSHFWWGAFDLACTRFSGRKAPLHAAGIPNCPDYVVQEAYSRECISAGWWPGTAASPVAEAAFYAYAYPEPKGFDVASVRPSAAYYSKDLQEWILPYDAVRAATDPDAIVMSFLQSTYDAGARLANWDVETLGASLPEILDHHATGIRSFTR